MVVDPTGLRAETRVRVKRRLGMRATLVGVRLLTGRKHQIRLHLSHARHPVAGDDRYGDREFNQRVPGPGGNGIYLHAVQLVIPTPHGTDLAVTAPTPPPWNELQNSR